VEFVSDLRSFSEFCERAQVARLAVLRSNSRILAFLKWFGVKKMMFGIFKNLCLSDCGRLGILEIFLRTQILSFLPRGVTRLDGAQGKKQVWRPPCWNLRSYGSNVTVLNKVLVTLLGLFGASRSDSAPGELCPPCPPLSAPVSTTVPSSTIQAVFPSE